MAIYGIVNGLAGKWNGAVRTAKKLNKLDGLARYVDWSKKLNKWVVWVPAPESGNYGFIVSEHFGDRQMQTVVGGYA